MLAVLHDIDTAPQLATAFGDYRTHQVMAYTHEDPRLVAVDAPVSDAGGSLDAERIARRHQLGKTGVVLMVAGTGAAAVGAIMAFGGAIALLNDGGSTGAAAVTTGGVVLVLGGAVAGTVGEVMMFTGGIGASQLLGIPTTVGWTGVGLIAGGFVVGVVGSGAGSPELSTVGSLMSLGGFVCGAVQLGQSGRAGREANVLSWHLVPTPHGMGIAGNF